jgi:hypothetical protein
MEFMEAIGVHYKLFIFVPVIPVHSPTVINHFSVTFITLVIYHPRPYYHDGQSVEKANNSKVVHD